MFERALENLGLKENWWQETAKKNKFTPDINRLQHRACWWMFVYDEMQEGLPAHQIIKHNSRTYGEVFTDLPYTLWKRPLGKDTFPVALESDPVLKPVKPALIKGKLVNIATPKIIELDAMKQNTVQYFRKRINVNYHYHEVCEVRDTSAYTDLNLFAPTGYGEWDSFTTGANDNYTKQTTHFVMRDVPANGVVKRGPSQVSIPQVQSVRAWMYVGLPEYWLDMIKVNKIRTRTADGDLVKTEIFLSNFAGSILQPVTLYQPRDHHKPKYYYFNKAEFND